MNPFSPKAFLDGLKADVVDLLLGAAREISGRKIIYFVVLPAIAAAAAWTLFSSDISISDGFSGAKKENRGRYDLMKKVSSYGNFVGVAAACVALWGAGKAFGRRRLVLAGLSGILAASAAGLLDNAIRASTGRPRPKARIEDKLPDKFHGPSFDSHFQSFPSAHSATAFGAAAGVGLACPALAVPAFAGAGLVAFSRVYLLAHYPSDVTVGALIGIWFGMVLGLSSRKMYKKQDETAEN